MKATHSAKEREFQEYLETYRFEQNELIQCLFVERQFKYAEIAFVDSLTKQPIRNLPVFSGVCLDKKTASICVFDSVTVFNIFFPTDSLKSDFASLLSNQTAKCPLCGEEMQFSLLVCDSLLVDFFKLLRNQPISDPIVTPILRFERVRNKQVVKYAAILPNNSHTNNREIATFNGEVGIEKKMVNMSIEQFNRVQTELDADINDASKTEAEKKMKQQIKEFIALEQLRAKEFATDPQSNSAHHDTNAIDPPFRILKVGVNNESENLKAVQNTFVYILSGKSLYIAEPTQSFQRYFKIIQLFRKTAAGEIVDVNMDTDSEMKGYQSILVYSSVLLVVTNRKIYSMQLLSCSEVKDKEENTVAFRGYFEEIYTFEDDVNSQSSIDNFRVAQLAFLRDDLYVLEFNSSQEEMRLRVIEDLLVYPQERSIDQPQVYLELSEASGVEKVILLCDDHLNKIILITPDQKFSFDAIRNQWEDETDLDGLEAGQSVHYFEDKAQIIDRIFNDTRDVMPINIAKQVFWLFCAKNQFIYELDLSNELIQEVESNLNQHIASQNCVFKKNSLIYGVTLDNNKPLLNNNEEQLNQESKSEDQSSQFYEQLRREILSYQGNAGQEDGSLTYCKNFAMFSSSVFI